MIWNILLSSKIDNSTCYIIEFSINNVFLGFRIKLSSSSFILENYDDEIINSLFFKELIIEWCNCKSIKFDL